MRTRRTIPLLSIIIILVNCGDSEDIEYPIPKIISPQSGSVIYESQIIEIIWDTEDSTINKVDIQLLDSYESDYFDNARLIFDTLSNAYNQTITEPIRFEQGSHLPVYYAFRIRTNSGYGVSKWSDIHFFRFEPLTSLDVKELSMTFHFRFIATDSSDFNDLDYSAKIVSTNQISIDSILEAGSYDLQSMVFIKPKDGFVQDNAGFGDHIDYFVFGYHEPSRPDRYPFEELGFSYTLRDQDPIFYVPYGGSYRDIYEEMRGKKINVEAVYFLTQFRTTEEIIGKEHDFNLHLNFNCYFDN